MSNKHEEIAGRETVARDQLAKAIQARVKADEKLSETQAALKRGQEHLDNARSDADSLLSIAEENKAKATEESAALLADAFRKGTSVLSFTVAESIDYRDLDRARAKLAAVDTAYNILESEHKAAEASASKAKATVEALADTIIDLKIEKEASEVLTLQQELWARVDRLEGGFKLRKGPQLQALKDRVRTGLDRHKLAVAGNPELFGDLPWNTYLNKFWEQAEHEWAEYRKRLAEKS